MENGYDLSLLKPESQIVIKKSQGKKNDVIVLRDKKFENVESPSVSISETESDFESRSESESETESNSD
jgi:hypothetical protein